MANDTRGSGDYEGQLGVNDQRDTNIQIGLSLVLGVGAFLAFCVCYTCDTQRFPSPNRVIGSSSTLARSLRSPKEAERG